MKEKRGKILGAVLFTFLILLMFYLTFFLPRKVSKEKIELIELNGSNLLSESDYLTFTKLNDIVQYGKITLPVIKDRFEKHPYIQRADVELNGNNKVSITAMEKRIEAVLISDSKPYFISDNFVALPVLPHTKFVDLPVISNPSKDQQLAPYSTLKSEEIIGALKIIEAAKLTNTNLFKHLTEINLRNGGDIVLSFAGLKPPVIFGKNNEAAKMVYLSSLWDGSPEISQLTEDCGYIDLRFDNEIIVGGFFPDESITEIHSNPGTNTGLIE